MLICEPVIWGWGQCRRDEEWHDLKSGFCLFLEDSFYFVLQQTIDWGKVKVVEAISVNPKSSMVFRQSKLLSICAWSWIWWPSEDYNDNAQFVFDVYKFILDVSLSKFTRTLSLSLTSVRAFYQLSEFEVIQCWKQTSTVKRWCPSMIFYTVNTWRGYDGSKLKFDQDIVLIGLIMYTRSRMLWDTDIVKIVNCWYYSWLNALYKVLYTGLMKQYSQL